MKTTHDYMRVALTDDSADVRRQAVGKVCESRQVSSDWAFAGLAAVARSDADPQVRCVALRGLRRLDDARPVAVALTVLDHEHHADTVRAPDAHVRWECLLLLDEFCTRNLVPDDQHASVRTALITQLDGQPDRRVRVSAARGLRHFPHVDTLRALIKGLESPDFGVTSEAERALAALTGTTHDFDPVAWNQWLAETNDPFAAAGQLPDALRPPRETWWQRTKEVFW